MLARALQLPPGTDIARMYHEPISDDPADGTALVMILTHPAFPDIPGGSVPPEVLRRVEENVMGATVTLDDVSVPAQVRLTSVHYSGPAELTGDPEQALSQPWPHVMFYKTWPTPVPHVPWWRHLLRRVRR